jgi:hypothetical protein
MNGQNYPTPKHSVGILTALALVMEEIESHGTNPPLSLNETDKEYVGLKSSTSWILISMILFPIIPMTISGIGLKQSWRGPVLMLVGAERAVWCMIVARSDINNNMTNLINDIRESMIFEAFDKPYKWKITRQDDTLIHINFFIDGGSADRSLDYVQVQLQQLGFADPKWSIAFKRNETYNITGEGQAFRIFATVFDIITWFIKEKAPRKFYFSADKEMFDLDNGPNSREKLYTRFVKKYASKVKGYSYTIGPATSGGTSYTFTKN